MNLVILSGNLGSDPELRFTQGGQAVLNMRLATSERFKGKNDEWQEKTEWHSVVLWGKRAEGLSRVLAKGKTIVVRGSLATKSWEDKDGKKRYRTEVNAQDIELVGGRGQLEADKPRRGSHDIGDADNADSFGSDTEPF